MDSRSDQPPQLPAGGAGILAGKPPPAPTPHRQSTPRLGPFPRIVRWRRSRSICLQPARRAASARLEAVDARHRILAVQRIGLAAAGGPRGFSRRGPGGLFRIFQPSRPPHPPNPRYSPPPPPPHL